MTDVASKEPATTIGEARPVVGDVEADHVVNGSGERPSPACHRTRAVWRLLVEGLLEEGSLGEPAWLGARMDDVGQALGLKPLELAGVRSAAPAASRPAGTGRRRSARQRLEPRRARCPARLAADLDAESRRSPREGGGRPALRAGTSRWRSARPRHRAAHPRQRPPASSRRWTLTASSRRSAPARRSPFARAFAVERWNRYGRGVPAGAGADWRRCHAAPRPLAGR